MTYALTREINGIRFYWTVSPTTHHGRWVSDQAQAKIYTTERGSCISWTAVSKIFRGVKRVELEEVLPNG